VYYLQVQSIQVLQETGGTAVSLVSYLVGISGEPFLNSSVAIDTFVIRAPKVNFPGSGYYSFLAGLAQTAIEEKYASSITGTGVHGSKSISMSNTDLSKLFAGVGLTGAGIVNLSRTGNISTGSNTVNNLSSTTNVVKGMAVTGTGIPVGTIITNISGTTLTLSQSATATQVGASLTIIPVVEALLSDTYIQMSNTLILQYTGTTTGPGFSVTGDLASGSNIVTNVSSISGIVAGMSIVSSYLPYNTVVTTILTSPNKLILSQSAQASASGATLALSTATNNDKVTGISPANLDDNYLDMTIEFSTSSVLSDGTTLSDVLTSSSATISSGALLTTTSAFTLSGEVSYSVDTSVLSIDYSDLQRVVDTINFNLL